jgi:hypothetical protein
VREEEKEQAVEEKQYRKIDKQLSKLLDQKLED